jgi:hypothetical protein
MTKTSIIGKYGYNLIMLSWYLHPFILALGIIGIILMIYKKPYESTYFFLGIMLIFFFFYISNIHHWWGGPWWMRRYVFAVVPLIYIGVGYFITELSNSFHEKNRKFILSLLALSLIISTLMISSPIIGHVEYKGAIGQVEKIFDSFDDNSVLIFADSRYPPIAYPLWSIYDKNVIYLRQDHWGWVATPRNSEDVDIVLKACAKWNREGKKVYIVNPTDKFINSFKGRLNFDFYRYGKIDVPWLTYSKGEFPTDFRQIVRHIRIYEVKLINE